MPRWMTITTTLFFLSLAACSPSSSAGAVESQSAPPLDQASEAQAPTLDTSAISIDGLPNGVLIDPLSGDKLFIYNTRGQYESVLDTPGLSSASAQYAHMAGTGSEAPLVYYSWDPEQALQINQQGNISTFRSTNGFFGLAGAHGQPVIAFSEVTVDGMIPHSYLYAGNLDTLPTTNPFFDFYDENMQMALLPVAVDATAGQPQTIWYTQSAWGIGGVDLIFPINRGLYAYDLGNHQSSQVLDPERNFQGISLDMRFAASINFDAQADRKMTVTEISSRQDTAFSLREGFERGSGYAVFSPDSQLVAWLEAGGSFAAEPSTYHSIVRIGEVANGAVDYDIEDTSVAQALNLGTITYMEPAGWLDNQTLLIETRTSDWGQVVLVSANLADGTLTYFCDGAFAGFTYP